MEATSLGFLWTVPTPTSTTTSKQFRTKHVARGTQPPLSSALTLGQWLEELLELCTRRGLRPSTVASYGTMVRLHVGTALAATPLASVTARDLNELYRRLLREGRRDRGGGLSARTVRYLHTLLTKAFSDAVRAGASPRQSRCGRRSTVDACDTGAGLSGLVTGRAGALSRIREERPELSRDLSRGP